MRNEKFILRPFETPDDHRQCEHIQAVTWSHEEVVPSNITIAMTYHGALALGAFSSDGVMLGMVFSFLSPAHVPGANKGLSHHSHMAAVLPDYRGQGVGEALKRINQRLDNLELKVATLEAQIQQLTNDEFRSQNRSRRWKKKKSSLSTTLLMLGWIRFYK